MFLKRYTNIGGRRAFCMMVLLLFVSISHYGLIAETIQYKDGRVIQGRIVSQDRQRVVLRNADGVTIIPKDQIRRITYDDANPQATESNETAAERRAAEARRKAEMERRQREAEQRRQAEAERQRREEERRRREERQKQAELEAQQEAEQRAREQDQQSETVNTDANGDAPDVDAWGPLWRSLLLPGWGQIYADQNLMGFGYAFLFLGSAGYAGSQAQVAGRLKSDYVEFTDTAFLVSIIQGGDSLEYLYYIYNESQSKRIAYRAAAQRANAAGVAVATVYLIQAIHALLIEKDLNSAFRLHKEQQNRPGISISCFAGNRQSNFSKLSPDRPRSDFPRTGLLFTYAY